MTDLVTIDSIQKHFEDSIQQKLPIGPGVWIDAAQKINVLLGDEHDKLYVLEQQVAEMKAVHISDTGFSVAKANAIVEASPITTQMKMQRAKIGRIEEFIKIAKVQARMKDNEYRGY